MLADFLQILAKNSEPCKFLALNAFLSQTSQESYKKHKVCRKYCKIYEVCKESYKIISVDKNIARKTISARILQVA